MALLRGKTTRVWLDGTRRAEEDLEKTNGPMAVHERQSIRTMRIDRDRDRDRQWRMKKIEREGNLSLIEIWVWWGFFLGSELKTFLLIILDIIIVIVHLREKLGSDHPGNGSGSDGKENDVEKRRNHRQPPDPTNQLLIHRFASE